MLKVILTASHSTQNKAQKHKCIRIIQDLVGTAVWTVEKEYFMDY